jgi:hypothetical protein
MVGAPLVGCDEEEGSTCGNGKVGTGEDCDCGTDPEDLPPGCTGINGAAGSTCSASCELVDIESGADCANGADDDEDGATDCDDESCADYYRCMDEVCDNDYDDNGDGYTDCEDPDCADLIICVPETCDNGVDDNGDGHTDCQDEECWDDEACDGVEVCWNSIDDNGDGNTDCDDAQCVSDPSCEDEENPSHDNCYDELDNDGDGWVDCADPGCFNRHPCNATTCVVDQAVVLATVGQFREVDVDLEGEEPPTGDIAEPCGATGSREKIIEIEVATEGRLVVHYEQQDLHKIGLYFPAGADRGCGDALHRCSFPQGEELESGIIDYGNRPGGVYYLIVSEAIQGTGGQVELTVSLLGQDSPELCGNKIDDDSDGTIDCGDLDCIEAGASDCQGTDCVPDLDLGVISPGDDVFPDTIAGDGLLDLRDYGIGYSLSCLELGAQNAVIGFTVSDATGNIKVSFDQSMLEGGDHAFGLFAPGGVGTGCDSAESGCHYPGGVSEGVVDFGQLPPGDYFLIVKARAGLAGKVRVMVSSVPPGHEICVNGIEDNGDSLVDCADPTCTQHEACVFEDCSNGIDDDGDGLVDCADNDPDDLCDGCSYMCACNGGECSTSPPVCDGGPSGNPSHDPEIVFLGTCSGPKVFTHTLDVGSFPDSTVRNDYHECTATNTADDTPDKVLYLEVVGAQPIDVTISYDLPAQVYYVMEMHDANRCIPCDAGDVVQLCRQTAIGENESGMSGEQVWLDLYAGQYAIIFAPDHNWAFQNPDYTYGPITMEITCQP